MNPDFDSTSSLVHHPDFTLVVVGGAVLSIFYVLIDLTVFIQTKLAQIQIIHQSLQIIESFA